MGDKECKARLGQTKNRPGEYVLCSNCDLKRKIRPGETVYAVLAAASGYTHTCPGGRPISPPGPEPQVQNPDSV